MAKRKITEGGGINKSEAIREVLAQDPKTPAKEIIAILAARGIRVQPSRVYFIKGKMKRARRKQIGRNMAQAGVANPVDLILKVRRLGEQSGGMSKLKKLLDALAE
jgi:hypothetical protein